MCDFYMYSVNLGVLIRKGENTPVPARTCRESVLNGN